MTKKTLDNKFLKGIKKVALGAGIVAGSFLGINSNDVYAQKTSSSANEGEASINDKIGKFEVNNFDGVTTYRTTDQSVEKSQFFPTDLTIDIGGEHYPAVIYTPQLIEIDGGLADAIPFKPSKEEVFENLLTKLEGKSTSYEVYSGLFCRNHWSKS